MDKKAITLATAPIILIFTLVVLLVLVKFRPSLSLTEQRLSSLSFESVKVVRRQPAVMPLISSPIEAEVVQKSFPGTPLSQIAPQEPFQEHKVSFILTGGVRKMAIINGLVVHEGGLVRNRGRVAKIEKDRVLIKDDKGERWIKIR